MITKQQIARIVLVICLIPFLYLNVRFALNIRTLSAERNKLKEDYAEANSIKYGLLSVEEWMGTIKIIASSRISDFKFTKEQEDTLRIEITTLLNSLMLRTDSIIQHEHKTFKEKLRKFAFNAFIDKNKLKTKIPGYAKAILDEFNKPETREKLNRLVIAKLDEYAALTYETVNDKEALDTLLAYYHAPDIVSFNASLEKKMFTLLDESYQNSFRMLGTLILFLLLWLIFRNKWFVHHAMFVCSVLLAMIVLASGLSAPMIEIDARISKIDFFLIGEHIRFYDQILFFRSKSILQVVSILLDTHKADSIVVGALLLTFSILFPISKLISTEIYLLGTERIRRNKLIYFFAFRSSKWSMADVTVVAIFMAYIGFKGILDSQMQNLSLEATTYSSIATNHTSLQPGFILFTGFVLFSLILSELLKWIDRKRFRGGISNFTVE